MGIEPSLGNQVEPDQAMLEPVLGILWIRNQVELDQAMLEPVLEIRIRRIRMFLGLPDPAPDTSLFS